MRDPNSFRLSFILLSWAVAACGPNNRTPNGDDDTPDASNTNGGDSGNGDGCSDEAKLIYVVDQDNTLSTYDPVAKAFSDLGQLSCPAQLGASPFSMGIDRNATAWVLYSSGELFRVDTKTLQCTKTNWMSQNGLTQYGMGFSTNVAGGTEDTLFICGGASPTVATSKLNTLDTMTMTATFKGNVTGWPELTGTGNAELWGFFPTVTGVGGIPRVEQIDKNSGAPVKTYMLNQLSGDPLAWAFAFYGGNFYVFLQRSTDLATVVYEVNGTTGAIQTSTNTNTRSIVGAGVSTCAPVILL